MSPKRGSGRVEGPKRAEITAVSQWLSNLSEWKKTIKKKKTVKISGPRI